MEDERLDAVILGASGFTGKYVVRYFLGQLDRDGGQRVKIGIAGRSRNKVAEALRWAAAPSLPPANIPIIEADVTSPPSLDALCTKTKLVINCVGPYRLYGEPVVCACVESGVDYLDITGEPEFIEKMEAAYHQRAEETGSLVISTCGYDSIPAELGVIFHSRQWKPPSVPHSVDSYLVLESDKRIAGNLGTFESAVLGVANAHELQKLRRSRPRRAKPQVRRDGDVLLHCVVDAILGALGLPDIGQLFPDNDPKWSGANSSVFLKEAVRLMHEAGYELGNLDATLILQRPKVSPHKEAIRINLCELLGSDPSVINLKAKTHEKVDSLGENRSIAAHTVVLLMKK